MVRIIGVILRLGKARESTVLKSEDYKSAVRDYMESLGYAQTTDSSIEGHLPDMVFVPPPDRPWPKAVWVEAKAFKLSLGDRQFVEETCGYLKHWLNRTRNSRFKFMIFARDLHALSKWSQIWDSEISEDSVLGWLKGSRQASELISKYPIKEIIGFFSETEVYQADVADLRLAVNTRMKMGTAAMEARTRAKRAAESMEQRAKPILKKSNLIGNLLQFTPPMKYLSVEIDTLSRDDLRTTLKDTALPYAYPTNGRLLLFDIGEMPTEFQSLKPKNVDRISIDDPQAQIPRGFSELMNNSFEKIVAIEHKRILPWRNWYFFLCDEEAKKGAPRTIETPSGKTMQVAKPLFKRTEGKHVLNFVFHHAFKMRYKKLWGEHFVSLGLRRLYTDDGRSVIEGDNSSKIDAKFRNSAWNRSETQQARMSKIAEYLFGSVSLEKHAAWQISFQFRNLLSLPTNWTPKAVEPEQAFISDYEEVLQ
jgi:hypothetical protein